MLYGASDFITVFYVPLCQRVIDPTLSLSHSFRGDFAGNAHDDMNSLTDKVKFSIRFLIKKKVMYVGKDVTHSWSSRTYNNAQSRSGGEDTVGADDRSGVLYTSDSTASACFDRYIAVSVRSRSWPPGSVNSINTKLASRSTWVRNAEAEFAITTVSYQTCHLWAGDSM